MKQYYIELIGLPGAGKSTISKELYLLYKEKGLKVDASLFVIANRRSNLFRFLFKILMSVLCLIFKPLTSFRIIRLVYKSKQKSKLTFMKLSINFMYIVGYIISYSIKYDLLLLDQGLYQAYWSVLYSSKTSDDLDPLFLKVLKIVKFKKITIINIGVDINVASNRIRYRNKVAGRLDRVIDNIILLKRELELGEKIFLKISDLLKTLSSKELVYTYTFDNNMNGLNIEKLSKLKDIANFITED